MKYHKKPPKYPCKHCFVGFSNRHSKWRHQQRCESNPEIVEWHKKIKRINKKLKKEEIKVGEEDEDDSEMEMNGNDKKDDEEIDKNEEK